MQRSASVFRDVAYHTETTECVKLCSVISNSVCRMRLMNVHDHVNYVSLRNIVKKVIISNGTRWRHGYNEHNHKQPAESH